MADFDFTDISGLTLDGTGTNFNNLAGNVSSYNPGSGSVITNFDDLSGNVSNFSGGSSGAQSLWSNITSNIPSTPAITISNNGTQQSNDLRVRLKAPSGREDKVYGAQGAGNILSILHQTGGMLFPYTPSVQFSQDVNYHASDLTHTNGDVLSYGGTPSVTLGVTGKFTVQNQREGLYAMAVIHFLRVASKMYFGVQDASAGLAGTPPTPLIFSGYGDYMFNNLRVILKQHSYSIDESVDHITVQVGSGTVRIPSLFSISMTLVVQQTPNELRTQFSLDAFRTGALMKSGGTGWI